MPSGSPRAAIPRSASVTPGPTWVQENPCVRPTMSAATASTSAAGTPHAGTKSRRYCSHHWPSGGSRSGLSQSAIAR